MNRKSPSVLEFSRSGGQRGAHSQDSDASLSRASVAIPGSERRGEWLPAGRLATRRRRASPTRSASRRAPPPGSAFGPAPRSDSCARPPLGRVAEERLRAGSELVLPLRDLELESLCLVTACDAQLAREVFQALGAAVRSYGTRAPPADSCKRWSSSESMTTRMPCGSWWKSLETPAATWGIAHAAAARSPSARLEGRSSPRLPPSQQALRLPDRRRHAAPRGRGYASVRTGDADSSRLLRRRCSPRRSLAATRPTPGNPRARPSSGLEARVHRGCHSTTATKSPSWSTRFP